MPRKAIRPSLAEQHAAPGGAAAVDRALTLLGAFRPGDASLSLAELAERTLLYKSTALRLIASLEHARLLQRQSDGRYALGSEVERLHGIYAGAFSLEDRVLPVLTDLAARTREAAAFHVRQGEQRLCVLQVDSPQGGPATGHPGELLPLDRGASGRVLLAFSEARGGIHAQIRRDGVVVMRGDRSPELTGIAAPVIGVGDRLLGALVLTLPSERMRTELADAVRESARRLTERLGGRMPQPEPATG